MPIGLDQLQSKFNQVKSSLDLVSIENTARELTSNINSFSRTLENIPTEIGPVSDNIRALVNVTDDFPRILEGTLPLQPLRNATTLLQNLQNVMPELQRPVVELAQNGRLDVRIQIPINNFPSELAAIVEGPITSGFNDLTVGLGTAFGIASMLNNTASSIRGAIGSGDILGLIQAVGSQDVSNLLNTVGDALNIKGDIFGSLGEEFSRIERNFSDVLTTITNSPLLDMAHDLNRTLNIIGNDFGISADLSKQVLNTLRDGGVSATISLIGDRTNIPILELESKLNEYLNTITNLRQLVRDPISVSSTPTLSLSAIKDEWKRGIFRYIRSSSEIAGELRSATREIDTIVIHWSETYLDQDIGATELNNINNQGIPYHYVIKRDGSVQRGRNINEVGAHTESPVDDTSIGIILIAGYPTYLGDDTIGLSGDSLTQEQMSSLERVMRAFYDVNPGAEAVGHGELGGAANPAEPGFDVSEFVRRKFGITRDNIDRTTAPPRIENTGVPRPIIGGGSRGGVVYAFNRNTTRSGLLQPDLKNILEEVALETNITIYITSGGQLPNAPLNVPGGRTGSNRHDYGWGADWLAKDENNNFLNFGTDNPSTKVLQVYNALVSKGITGIGAGRGYMGSNGVHAIHTDIAYGRNPGVPGPRSRWGRGGQSSTAAAYIR